jgi:N utilization substance protein B
MEKIKPSHRRKARSLALQAIYQWQLTGDSAADIRNQFSEKITTKKVDLAYFHTLLDGVIAQADTIDQLFIPLLDRKIGDLDMVEIAVLRMAVYELLHRTEIPHKVVINEALELTKIFGSSEGYKYINGVLDTLVKKF